MLLRQYFVIGSAGQQPYEAGMSKLLAPKLVCVALFTAFTCGCSRGKASQGAPSAAVSSAASAATPLAAGALAPDVTFELHTGEKLALSSLRGKPVVVYFYPKDDTPGCTIEAQEIRDLYAQLKQTGAVVIGVSTDALDSHRAFAEKHALPFLLASDEAGDVAKAFGVPLKNGRVTRVSFVIGADGRIKRSFPAVTPKGHAAELLTAISS
jgi:thioredoxin-dependent peroxiredoxin